MALVGEFEHRSNPEQVRLITPITSTVFFAFLYFLRFVSFALCFPFFSILLFILILFSLDCFFFSLCLPFVSFLFVYYYYPFFLVFPFLFSPSLSYFLDISGFWGCLFPLCVSESAL